MCSGEKIKMDGHNVIISSILIDDLNAKRILMIGNGGLTNHVARDVSTLHKEAKLL